jgi:hypothetical protein
MNEAKPFCISKYEVWEAYKRVKAMMPSCTAERKGKPRK